MCLLLETIQIKNGRILNISYHNCRFNSVRKEFFNIKRPRQLEDFINIPEEMCTGMIKCSITYGRKIENIHFSPYKIRNIKSVRLVETDISYAHKVADRKQLNKLKERFPGFDEILITKNGYITDTSYSNVVFLKKGTWYTPSNPLLKGTKREKLLEDGTITEFKIHRSKLKEYSHFMLINAMLDFDEERSLPIQIIKGHY